MEQPSVPKGSRTYRSGNGGFADRLPEEAERATPTNVAGERARPSR